MKVKNIYNKITNLNVIMNMYDYTVRINTKNKEKVEKFDNFYSQNIVSIKDVLASKKYSPERYNIFLIKEPKVRVIMSQNIKDKIVNHLVAQYFLVDVFDKSLIESNCATRVGKGAHYALKLFKRYYNNMINTNNKFYVLKFDISKYFYNIDHQIVKELIRNKISDKDVLDILDRIIDSTDGDYINKKINSLGDNLPNYKKGKGFPIGNMTSQIIATFYLNELDHFIKEKLDIKYYIRYMDDGMLLHHDKDYLKHCLKEIKKILYKYKLELKKKTKICSSSESIDFLGFRFSYNKRIISKVKTSVKKKIKIKLTKKYNLYKNDIITYDKYREVRDSYTGHLSHGNCGNLCFLILKKN